MWIYILMIKLPCSMCAEICFILNQNKCCGNCIEPFQWTVFRAPKISVEMMDKNHSFMLYVLLPLGPECYTLKNLLKAIILRENRHTMKSMQNYPACRELIVLQGV